MFGLSFGELCVLLIVAVVVLGPKDLPRYLRKGGQMAGKLRRLAFEMRAKSGIDELLRAEGIDLDIAEIRRLARGEVGGVVGAVRSTAELLRATAPMPPPAPTATVEAAAPALPAAPPPDGPVDREYPPEGPDAYGALPDTSTVYDNSFPASPLADDPLYTRGEPPSLPAPPDSDRNGEGVAVSPSPTPASEEPAAFATSDDAGAALPTTDVATGTPR